MVIYGDYLFKNYYKMKPRCDISYETFKKQKGFVCLIKEKRLVMIVAVVG